MQTPTRRFALFALVWAVVTVGVSSADGQTFLTNGLAAYYPFGGNATDISGNGMHGTSYGATLTTDRFGLANNAYNFDESSWIRLPDEILPVSTPEATLSMWVLAGTGPYPAQQTLIDLTSRRGECTFVITPGETPSWGFGVHLQSHGWQAIQSPMIPAIWTHLVGIYKQGECVQFWVDGSLVQSNTIPQDTLFLLQGYNLNSAIGIYDFAPTPYSGFNGRIDDVRIYRRALSATEVQQLHQIEAAAAPTVFVTKAVRPSFSSLVLGANYQLQLSGDSLTWTNHGLPFAATNNIMSYPQYWDVENWTRLFFRLQIAP